MLKVKLLIECICISFLPSFMGISQSLPQTGYVKMVDIWMIFIMSYPFFVIFCHCGKEVLRKLFCMIYNQVLVFERKRKTKTEEMASKNIWQMIKSLRCFIFISFFLVHQIKLNKKTSTTLTPSPALRYLKIYLYIQLDVEKKNLAVGNIVGLVLYYNFL